MTADIGVKIGVQGDQQYKQSLKDIIQETKTLNAEMKATESAFDKNASAQDKARAKMEVLNKQVEKQKEYIEKLKQEVEKASGEYDENSAKVLKLKENLAKAETALNKMQSEQAELNDTIKKAPLDEFKQKLDQIGEKLQNVGGKMKEVGSNMTKYVTAPLTAVAGLSVKAFTEVDDAMDELAKMTGKTGDELKDLETISKGLATTLPVSFEDAAKAVGEVNTRFDVTGEQAEELSQQFLKFAQLNGTDVVQSIDSVQSALTAWGIPAEKTSRFLDTLTKVSQDTGTSVDTLSDVLMSNKTVFDEMGLSVEEAATFLGNLEKNGVDSSTAMSGLKKAFTNATKDGKSFKFALLQMQTALTSADTTTEEYTAVMELFGNKAGPQLADALKDGRISLNKFGIEAEDSLGTVDRTFEQILDPADKFKTMMNQLKVTGAEVGGTLLEALAPAIEKVAEFIKKAAEWWSNLSPQMQNTILIVAGILAAVGPLVSVIGTIVSVVGTLIPLIGAATAAIGALNISLGPILLIIAAVVAVIIGVIEVVKHWGEITEWLGETWKKVTGWIKDAATKVGNWVSDKWDKVTSWTSEAWSNVKEWTSEAWGKVKETVKGAVDSVKENVVNKWNTIKETTTAVWNAVKEKIRENGGGIKGILTTATEGFKTIWQNAFTWINNKTGGKLGEVVTKVQEKLQSIKDKFTNIFETVKNTVKNAIDRIKSFFNFSWSLPKIKLPHFSITGSFSLSPPSIPRISVSWYKKAYQEPMLFTSPTVLATTSGLKGFGDGAGGEIVIGQNMMQRMITQAVRSAGGGRNEYDIDITVNGAAGQDVDELADAIAQKLTFEIQRREAALA